VVVGEVAVEGQGQFVLLGSHPALRQIGEHLGFTLTGDESADHGACRLRPRA
jgi:hypothetical protein